MAATTFFLCIVYSHILAWNTCVLRAYSVFKSCLVAVSYRKKISVKKQCRRKKREEGGWGVGWARRFRELKKPWAEA